MASVKVFGSPVSTEVARVLACLMEKEVDFQLIRMDTYKGDTNVPDFVKLLDPSGQVTYQEGKKTLVASREICRHICQKYADQGNKHLIGCGTLERASMEEWLQTEEQSFERPSSHLILHFAFAPLIGREKYSDHTTVNHHRKQLERVLNVYEQQLSENQFLAGDVFTLADLSHLPNSHYLMKTEIGRELFTERKNVKRWWEEISGRKSWEAVAAMQGDFPKSPEQRKDVH